MASIGIGGDPHVQSHTAYSGWWKRVGATLIDGLIIFVPAFIIALALGEAGSAIAFVLVFVIALFYAPLLMARGGSANGQTFGKQAVGIRVRHQSGQPMTFGRGVIRDFVGKSVLGLIPLYSLIDSLFPLWDDHKQAIHDKLGSTTVHNA